jgi:RHS repeat-associated protein
VGGGTTPQAQYTWDATPPGGPIANINDIGRLAVTWSPNYTGSKYNYDPMGRVANSLDCIDVSCNWNSDFSYTYDLVGNLKTYTNKMAQWTNPPVRSITFNQLFDSAGRVTQLTSNWVDAQHPATLATVDPSVGYYPNGAIRKLTLGNGLTETASYNNRLQPCRMNVNSSGAYYTLCTDAVPTGNMLDFSYGFNLGSADNGNLALMSATGQQTFNRSYGYDSLNRLQSMSAPGSPCSGLSWTVDPWGNRTDQTPTGGTCNPFHSGVATVQNRFMPPYQYDAAGNMTYDGAHSYTYDAENRITKVDGGATASYAYDPMGRRVQKIIGGATMSYVYDLAGNSFLETQGSNWVTFYLDFAGGLRAQYKNGVTSFIHRDHLGSTRLVTAMNQSPTDNLDYLPFGEQVSGDTATSHKFTGKERDAESGLDMFGARYYASTMGRFMTPDWAAKPVSVPYAHFGNPQSLNLYSYVQNNPTTTGDPDGHCPGPGDECSKVKVEAKVTEQPKIIQNQPVDGANKTGVKGTIQDTITVNGKTLNDTKVDEKNSSTSTLNGTPHDLGTVEGPSKTNNAGQVNDTVGLLAPAGTPAEDKSLVQTLQTGAVTMTNTNTITFTTPGGDTCSCTATRTLTNVGPDGKPSSTYTLDPGHPVVTRVEPKKDPSQ